MKKLRFAILLTCLFSVYAHAYNDNTMSITANPIAIIVKSFDVKYALKLNDKIAFTIPATLQLNSRINLDTQSEIALTIFSFGGGAKFSLTGSALADGWYVEPRLVAGFGSVSFDGYYPVSSFFLRPAALSGYSWVWDSGVTLNLAFGLFYNYAFSQEAPSISKAIVGTKKNPLLLTQARIIGVASGFAPTGEFSVGFSW